MIHTKHCARTIGCVITLMLASYSYAATHDDETAPAVTADQAMKMLAEGNARYVVNNSEHPRASSAHRVETATKGQKPFVTIVTCSDSRVPPEIIFDAGIGDLFVIRVAGNVCDTDEIGTVEYGTEHLGTPLLVILGHTKCGAVTAVVTKTQVHGSIPKLVDNIAPAVDAAQKAHPDLHGEALVPEATRSNVWQSISDVLKNSEIVRDLVKGGKLKIVGAMYDIKEGKVEWMGPHPKEKELLASADPAEHAPATRAATNKHDAPSGHPSTAPAAAHTKAEPAAHAPKAAAAERAPTPVAHVAHAAPTSQPATAHKEVKPTGPASPITSGAGLLERFMAEELYRQGTAAVAKGEYSIAMEKFRSALEADPSLLAAKNDLAGVYYLQRQYDKAAVLYKDVLTEDPNRESALRGLALVYASQKSYSQSRDILLQLAARNERDAQIWLDLGDVDFLMGDINSARKSWTTASEVQPNAEQIVRKANQRLSAYAERQTR